MATAGLWRRGRSFLQIDFTALTTTIKITKVHDARNPPGKIASYQLVQSNRSSGSIGDCRSSATTPATPTSKLIAAQRVSTRATRRQRLERVQCPRSRMEMTGGVAAMATDIRVANVWNS